MDVEPSPSEREIRARLEAGDRAGAVTYAIEVYGAELYDFLVGLSGDRDLAGDVFGAACERMWKSVDGFRWECSFRGWMYTIGRNLFLTERTRAKRQVPLSGVASIDAAVARVRTETPVHLRSEVKERFAKVRETLTPDDHMLLGLRLDRRLPWNDIAKVMDAQPAALRKRYQRLKERLEELADELLGDP